jgi:hypothetical protein
MRTIPEITEKIIQDSPYILEGMRDQLLNLSALARHIQPSIEKELKKEVKTAAIIMALKRMNEQLNPILDLKLQKVIQELDEITVRSNLVEFTFKNSDTLKSKQASLVKALADNEEVFFTLCRGVFETTLVISLEAAQLLEDIYQSEECLSNISDLSSITIKLPSSNTEVPGVYYYLLKRLAWSGVNISAVISTTNEFTIVLKESEVDRAFSIINQLRKSKLK